MATQKERDMLLMLAAQCHLGTKNLDHRMERYIWKRRDDGVYLFNLEKTWQKLRMAAQIIVAIEDPVDIVVQSARPYGQRAALKFAHYVGCNQIAGRHTPGTFTNQIQKQFQEPRLLIVTDPRTDHQPVTESSFVGIPVIAFCDSDSPVHYVDVAIPCNNRSKNTLAVMYWLLARTVLQMRGTLVPDQQWDVMVDLFIYREPEELKEPEEEQAHTTAAPLPAAGGDDWGADVGAGYGGGVSGFEAADTFVPAGIVPATAFGDSFGDSFGDEPPSYTPSGFEAAATIAPPPLHQPSPAPAVSDDTW